MLVEQELELLQKSKSQLEEYKIQYAEANIQIDELTLRVDQKDQQLKMVNMKSYSRTHFFIFILFIFFNLLFSC